MNKHIFTIAVILALVLAACGGSGSDSAADTSAAPIEDDAASIDDEAAPIEDDAGPADDDGDLPGLTESEINDPDLLVVGSYDINGDELVDGSDGPPSADAVETFAIYTGLIPAEYRQGVVAFVAIDQEMSDGTDGALQDVSDIDGEPTGQRYLALDVTGSSVEMERTIVHETGHLIFVAPGGDPTAYAVDFNEQFPPGAEYDPSNFVTEYAASAPDGGEDIAESWAMFVYAGTDFAGDADDDGELDEVPAGTLAAEKVVFFEDYPELVQLRDDILN